MTKYTINNKSHLSDSQSIANVAEFLRLNSTVDKSTLSRSISFADGSKVTQYVVNNDFVVTKQLDTTQNF